MNPKLCESKSFNAFSFLTGTADGEVVGEVGATNGKKNFLQNLIVVESKHCILNSTENLDGLKNISHGLF